MRQRPKVIAVVAEMLRRAEGTKQNKEQQKNTSRKRGIFCLYN